MSGQAQDAHFPAQAVWGGAALALFALAGAAGVQLGLFPRVADPEAMRAEARVQPVQSRDLLFEDGPGGTVVVREPAGAVVEVIRPDSEQGFVRGVMRGLARERRLRQAPTDTPFRLTLWDDNGLTLTDLATGRQIELGAFGPTNRAAFAVLLRARGEQP